MDFWMDRATQDQGLSLIHWRQNAAETAKTRISVMFFGCRAAIGSGEKAGKESARPIWPARKDPVGAVTPTGNHNRQTRRRP